MAVDCTMAIGGHMNCVRIATKFSPGRHAQRFLLTAHAKHMPRPPLKAEQHHRRLKSSHSNHLHAGPKRHVRTVH